MPAEVLARTKGDPVVACGPANGDPTDGEDRTVPIIHVDLLFIMVITGAMSQQ